MNSILKKAKQHCIHLLEQGRCTDMAYHNLQHTREVYRYVQLIGTFEELGDSDLEILKLAALFHDTGLSKIYLGHEAISVENAKLFLETNHYSKLKLDNVIACIEATRLPQQPKSHLEAIICDADLFHLSSENYFEKNKLLRKEWKLFLNKIYSDTEWIAMNVGFLENHHYHTDYGHKVLEAGKLKNSLEIQSIKIS